VTFALTVALAAGADASGGKPLLGASSNEHVWLVLESEDPAQGAQLLHQYAADGQTRIQTMISLPQVPEAITAWSDRLWLFFTPEGKQGNRLRELFSVRARLEPATGLYVLEPSDRLGLVASPQGEGDLVALTAAAGGPLVLIVPNRVQRTGSRSDDAVVPRLLQLRNDTWIEQPLPEMGTSRSWWLLVGGEQGQFISILGDDPEQRRHAQVWTRGSDEQWTATSLDLDPQRVLAVSTVGGRYPLIVDRQSEGILRLTYLRGNRLVPLTQLPRPEQEWAILGTRHDIRLFEHNPDGITISFIDQVTGRSTEPRAMDAPMPRGRVWYVSVLLAVTVAALLFAFLVRPGSSAVPASLPANQEVIGLPARMTGLLIDLFPGALLSVLVLDCRPIDLLVMPLASAAPDESLPYLVMIVITFLHTTVSEMIRSRTLGKLLVGSRVVTLQGGRPSATWILVRNLLKLLTLLIPPLAVIVLFNPNQQGLGDVVARTLVVREPEPAGS
jgi:uncharacterized RDD family membrane protein YckC